MRSRRGRSRSPRTEPKVETIRIDSIAAGGEGVGRLSDGRAVFVHRTAPGDLVDASVFTSRPRWARGRLLDILEPSELRRDAPCRHYLECGGCTIEHLTYEAQLAAKSRIVADALSRIGGIDVGNPIVVPSPREFRYRNRVSFALRRSGEEVISGFHALHDPSRVVPVDGACLLLEEPLAIAWDRLRAVWGARAELLPSGPLLRLTLRATATGDVSLLVEGGEQPGHPDELLARVPELRAIWHVPEDGTLTHLGGEPGLPEIWAGSEFMVGGAAFLQVNREAAELLEEYVAEIGGDVSGRCVVDSYCGIGAHGRGFAERGASVTGIELDPVAAAIAASLARRDVAILEGRVEDRLPEALPADLVLLNPPRAGVDRAAIDAMLAIPPERIVYISCDPATLARDVRILSERYEPGPIRCFDMFPQTAHVETVLVLDRRREPAS